MFTPRRARAQKLTIYYDQPCLLCGGKKLPFAAYLSIFGQNYILLAQSKANIAQLLEQEFSWVVEDDHGALATKTAALVALFRASPVFFVFAPVIQLVVPLGDRVYRWIGAHREGFGRVFAVVFPWRDEAKPWAAVTMGCSCHVGDCAGMECSNHLNSGAQR